MKDRDKGKQLLIYMDYIHRLADNNVKEQYTNSGPDRAAIVFNELFSNSTKEFRIYAGSMSGEISSKILYLSGIRQFLQKKNTKLKILIEDESKISQNQELIKILTSQENAKKVEIRKSKVTIQRGENDIHFSVGDDIRYRIEVDTSKYKAFGSFNDTKEGSELNAFFDNIFNNKENSAPLTLN